MKWIANMATNLPQPCLHTPLQGQLLVFSLTICLSIPWLWGWLDSLFANITQAEAGNCFWVKLCLLTALGTKVDESRVYHTKWSEGSEKQISYINAYTWNLERWCWWTYLDRAGMETWTWENGVWTQWGKERVRWTEGVAVTNTRCCCCWVATVTSDCAIPQMAAHQAPSSLGFSRQEHWSGLPLPSPNIHTAAAAAKLLQLCLTPCDPIHSSPPGSPIPGILQARVLEWVAISFSEIYTLSCMK